MITNWLSTRAFIAAALIGLMAAFPALEGGNYFEASVTIISSGLFWGWVLTKWAGRWFRPSDN